ncbi:MAG TPA: hypothetical protein H9714_02575 [Candidatus Flavonifractor intestinipullorum]|uniref:Uncharacterized protein n=1 Tax=Candidatus Flavonifractor intestinipullorum TaxID=2838587 RepID=A0A9D2S557_9FIRM|nr:hypothetical protein [Candidatus Flavonifractor intestinipullorum]
MRLPPGHHRRSKKRLREGGDTELELLYYLFHVHHWTPEMYAGMGAGGQDLALALALHEIEMKQET